MVDLKLSERVRRRLKDELYHRRITQRDAALKIRRLTGEEWSHSRINKILNGLVELRLDDVVALCAVAGLSLVEVVREPGKEFVADLTPTELRLLDAVRTHPESVPALLQLLGPAHKPAATRGTVKRRMEDDRGW